MNTIYNYNLKFIFDKEVNQYKIYIDKIIFYEQNIIILEEYLKLLNIIKNEESEHYNINYTRWLFFLESIFIHIDFINNINKKYRINNMNKLIDGLSKKAADVGIDLTHIFKKEILSTIVLLKENQNNLLFTKNNIERLLLSI